MTDRYSESLPKHGGDAFNHSAWGDFNVVHLLSMSNHNSYEIEMGEGYIFLLYKNVD